MQCNAIRQSLLSLSHGCFFQFQIMNFDFTSANIAIHLVLMFSERNSSSCGIISFRLRRHLIAGQWNFKFHFDDSQFGETVIASIKYSKRCSLHQNVLKCLYSKNNHSKHLFKSVSFVRIFSWKSSLLNLT